MRDYFSQKLKSFLHDPIDKALEIRTHEQRAKDYADILGVSGIKDSQGSDWIASAMERSLLPKGIQQELTEIRHPLAKTKLDLPKIDSEKVEAFIKEAYKKLAEKVENKDEKAKFLYLWRNLLEFLRQKSNQTDIKKFLSLLPADTRIPDHSIWEHLKISSSLDAFWDEVNKQLFQNNALFLFAVGPVQSFISQARKTQDLFLGSFILSYLTFRAIEKVVESYGPTNVIYPDLYGQPLMDFYLHKKDIEVKNSSAEYITQPTIPNRFVAIIPMTEKDGIKKFAKELEDAIKNEWRKMVETVLNEFGIPLDSRKEKQLKNFPEIYWVSIPLKIEDRDVEINNFSEFFEQRVIENWEERKKFADKKGEYPANIGFLYQLAYTALEKSMGARKNLRNFEQTEEHSKKCHLCGEREGVIKKGSHNLEVGKYISEKEGLCIPCFTKRALDKYLERIFKGSFRNFSFPSTAEVTCSDFKMKILKNAETKKLFKDYIEEFIKVIGKEKFIPVPFLPKLNAMGLENLDGEWFFEENIREKEFSDQFGIMIDSTQIEKLKNKLKNLIGKVGMHNPYYAVLMFDADDMGKWLSGEKLPSIGDAYNSQTWNKLPQDFKDELKKLFGRKILTPAIHASISHALRNYSIEFVRKIVEEEHLGKLVYAGGDDVLAFVNLKDLFPVMRKLRAAFSGNIKIENSEIKIYWNNETGFVEKDGKLILTMGQNATISGGVVIAHYKTPLKTVLDKVRLAEEKAKEGEKDSFAIYFLKHSGEERIAKSKWRDGNLDVLEKLSELGKLFQKKEDEPWVSKKFIYNLSNEFQRLKKENGYFIGSDAIFKTELNRLIERAIHGGDKETRKVAIKKVCEDLNQIFSHTGLNFNNFINFLLITETVSGAEE